jgi:UDP-N-acetylmuramoyl-tripeptide--D-alanyl-D-alanine ligase
MRLSLRDIQSRVGGTLAGEDVQVDSICIDSRQATSGSLFCAIKGSHVDGHDFVAAAANAGASAAMVTRRVEHEIPQLIVGSIEFALAELAKSIRKSFDGIVIGVTGSVGKTSTKEMLAGALGSRFEVLKTEGNLNTEYGVPKTWMELTPTHRFAVIEMGMRGVGQIRELCKMSQPRVGVITAIGSAHVGELGSLEMIKQAKSELFESLPSDGLAIAPFSADLKYLRSKAACRLLTFGKESGADSRVVSCLVNIERNTTNAVLSVHGREISIAIPAIGAHQATNAAAAMLVCSELEVDLGEAADRLQTTRLPYDRLRRVPYRGATILVDVYNSSPESCREALAVLDTTRDAAKRIAILGDMKELGNLSVEFHQAIGREAAKVVDKLVAVGEFSREMVAGARQVNANIDAGAFESNDIIVQTIRGLRVGDVLLIKGSRALKLEETLREAEVDLV